MRRVPFCWGSLLKSVATDEGEGARPGPAHTQRDRGRRGVGMAWAGLWGAWLGHRGTRPRQEVRIREPRPSWAQEGDIGNRVEPGVGDPHWDKNHTDTGVQKGSRCDE